MEETRIHSAACTIKADGSFIRWNLACETLTGYTADQVRSLNIDKVLTFDVPGDGHIQLLDNENSALVAYVNRSDGSKIAVRITVSPEKFDLSQGKAYCLIMHPLDSSEAALVAELPVGDIIEDLPCIFYMIDQRYNLTFWNHQLQDVLEMNNEEIRSSGVLSFFHQKEQPLIAKKMEEAFQNGHSSIEADLISKSGKNTSFLFQCARTAVAGQPCLFGTGLDISSRKQIEQGLQVRERALYSSLNAIVITCLTEDSIAIEYVNPAFEKMTGYTLSEIKGKNPKFMRIEGCDIHEHERLHFAIEQRKSVHSLLRNRKKTGEVFWNDLRIDPVTNAEGEVTHFVATLNDVTAAKHYERRLHHLAHHDPLTGLANRNLLMDRLKQAIENVAGDHLQGALAFIDIDNFKHINDNFGHNAGDIVLREIGDRLVSCLRSDDTVARFGGDEFVLLIETQSSRPYLVALLERIRLSLSKPMNVSGHEIVPGASIGVSVFPPDGTTVDDVMRAADAAMYHAKSVGKNNVQFFSTELGQAMHKHLILQATLNRAISNDELLLEFQPKVCLKSGQVVGAEALVRWPQSDHELMLPDGFIPIAEETGLIIPLGNWVLQSACTTLANFAMVGIDDLTISINISAKQLRQRDFARSVEETLKNYNVKPANLELEVTESQLMDYPEDARQILIELKALGIRISIDDFGTGYSSLSHLRTFPVDFIKIDRSFLTDLRDDDNAVIPRTIISLGHNLKLKVIAEGVETREQLEFLQEHDCDQIQGFYFSPAVTKDCLQDMVARGVSLRS